MPGRQPSNYGVRSARKPPTDCALGGIPDTETATSLRTIGPGPGIDSIGTTLRAGGVKPADQAWDAGIRAIEAYTRLTDKNCPFKVMTLKPSQHARTLLGSRG